MSRPRAMFLLACMVSETGCGAGWHQITPPAPSTLPERQQVQVWQDQRVLRLHGVRLTADSISGVLFTQPPSCDSCRVGIPRISVDSIRAGSPTAGFWKTVGLTLGGLLVLGLVLCGTASSCQLEAD